MARFRSKPAEVEAVQFTGEGADPPGAQRCGCAAQCDPATGSGAECNLCGSAFVTTAHGDQIRLSPGDWVVTEPDGRGFYPVKADIFAARWEPVEG